MIHGKTEIQKAGVPESQMNADFSIIPIDNRAPLLRGRHPTIDYREQSSTSLIRLSTIDPWIWD